MHINERRERKREKKDSKRCIKQLKHFISWPAMHKKNPHSLDPERERERLTQRDIFALRHCKWIDQTHSGFRTHHRWTRRKEARTRKHRSKQHIMNQLTRRRSGFELESRPCTREHMSRCKSSSKQSKHQLSRGHFPRKYQRPNYRPTGRTCKCIRAPV